MSTELRIAYVKHIITMLANEMNKDKKEMVDLAKTLEKSILKATITQCNEYGEQVRQYEEYTPVFLSLYKSNMRTLLNNCRKNNYIGNQNLLYKINKAQVTAEEIASSIITCPQALYIEKNKKYYDEIEKQEHVAYNKEININSQHRCPKCKQNKCTVNLAQLRGADEPMSMLITCLGCGNKWKRG